MDILTLNLSRIQFGLNAGVHFLFPASTLGIAFFIMLAEAIYLKTRNEVYKNIAKLGLKIFGLIFALGVASGLVMPFAFGTNWSNFVEYAGAVFGVHLTIEAVVAFMLETIFLGVMLFGRDRISPTAYFVCTFMVFFGSHLSGFIIIAANSWMQTPFHSLENLATGIPIPASEGFFLQQTLADGTIRQVMDRAMLADGGTIRVVMTDVMKIMFSPTTVVRFLHTIVAAWITGAVIFAAIAAYYMIKNPPNKASRTLFKMAAVIGLVASVAQPLIGHAHVMDTKLWQPNKNAGMEGHFKTENGAPLYIVGWVDTEKRQTYGIPLPYMLSFFESFNFTSEVEGLDNYLAQGAERDQEYKKYEPVIQLSFQSFHLMVLMGLVLVVAFVLAAWSALRDKWEKKKWLWKTMLWLVPAPYLAVIAGWFNTESGRQPWVIYGLLKVEDAVSPVPPEYVVFSLVVFVLVYVSLFVVLFRWLPRLVREGLELYISDKPAAEKTGH